MIRDNLGCSITLFLLWTTAMQVGAQGRASERPSPTPPDLSSLDWESANAKRMFIFVNDGSEISAISVDTFHLEDLQAALKRQELVFRIGAARMPIVDKRFVTVPWQQSEKPRYEVVDFYARRAAITAYRTPWCDS